MSTEPPQGHAGRGPVRTILFNGIGHVWDRRDALMRVTLIPLAASILVTYTLVAFSLKGMVVDLLNMIVSALLFAPIYVAIHQSVLEDVPIGDQYQELFRRPTLVLYAGLIILFGLAANSISWIFVGTATEAANPISAFLVAVPLTLLAARLAFVFPFVALHGELDWRMAWEAGKGWWLALLLASVLFALMWFMALMLVIVPFAILASSQLVAVIVTMLISIPGMYVGVAMLSETYRLATYPPVPADKGTE